MHEHTDIHSFKLANVRDMHTVNCHFRQLQVCVAKLTIYSDKVSLDLTSNNSSVDVR